MWICGFRNRRFLLRGHIRAKLAGSVRGGHQALSKVDLAENLVEKLSTHIEKTRQFVKKEKEKKNTSLEPDHPGEGPSQSRRRQQPGHHEPLDPGNFPVDKQRRYLLGTLQKTWVTREKTVKPVMADDLFRDYRYFKGVKYADLTKVTQKARENLEAMK